MRRLPGEVMRGGGAGGGRPLDDVLSLLDHHLLDLGGT